MKRGRVPIPDRVRRQLDRVLAELRAAAGPAGVRGVYLHGSLAMGCWNPRRSDVDFIVVTRKPLPVAARREFARIMLHWSGHPGSIEMSSVNEGQLRPWCHPAPFDFCFSEDWRGHYRKLLRSGAWRRELARPAKDEDLAGHLTVIRHRGVALWGEPIARAIPPVPRRDYLASVLADHGWAKARLNREPPAFRAYLILNACRTLRYLRTGFVGSKAEGGEWGLRALPVRVRPGIRRALAAYRSRGGAPSARDLARFLAYADPRLALGQ